MTKVESLNCKALYIQPPSHVDEALFMGDSLCEMPIFVRRRDGNFYFNPDLVGFE